MNRIEGLQWGRALAALSVVFAHGLVYQSEEKGDFSWFLGTAGVAVFFVISGFIMVVTTGSGPFDPFSFIRRRLSRIVPLYWSLTLLIAILAVAVPSAFRHTEFSTGHLVASLLFVPAYRPETGEIVPLLKLGWTLNFEMFFYVVFAMLCRLQALQRVFVLSGLFLGLSFLGAVVEFQEAPLEFYTRIDIVDFLAGVWLGILHQRGQLLRRRRAAFMASAIALAAIFALSAAGLFQGPLGRQVILVLSTSIVWALSGWVSKVSHKVPNCLSFLGDASYSIYLAHMFGLVGTVIVAEHAFELEYYPAVVVASTVAGILTGVAVYWLCERPLNRFVRTRLGTVRPSEREARA